MKRTVQPYRHIWWKSEEEQHSGNGIFCAGYFCNNPAHRIARPGLNEWILIYCIGGQGNVKIGNQAPVSAKRGMLFCIPEKTPHQYSAQKADPWSIYWVHFKGLLPQELMDRISTYLEIGFSETLQAQFEALLTAMEQPPSALRTAKCINILQAVLLRCVEALPVQHTMEAAKRFLEENCFCEESMEDVARQYGMSPAHFIRRFKQYVGMPPHQYRLAFRIRQVCRMLEDESSSIARISEQAGYGSPYYFSRQFKQVTGYSPSAYRALLRSV